MTATPPEATVIPSHLRAPQEVYEEIFSHLAKPSLSRCALVSHLWSISVRRTLFRAISIDETHPTYNLAGLLEGISSGQLDRIVSCVQELSLQGSKLGRFDAHASRRSISEYTKLSPEVVAGLLDDLPSLQILTLCHFHVTELRTPPSLPPSYSLRRLKLIGITFFFPSWKYTYDLARLEKDLTREPCGLIDLLNLFTRIDTLHLEDVDASAGKELLEYKEDRRMALAEQILQKRLSSLHIETLETTTVWFFKQRVVMGFMSGLRTLKVVEIGDWSSEATFTAFLKAVGHSLVELRFKFAKGVPQFYRRDQQLDLSTSMDLRIIRIFVDRAQLFVPNSVAPLIQSLFAKPPPCISEVYLHIFIPTGQETSRTLLGVQGMQWEAVDERLNNCGKLKKMEVSFRAEAPLLETERAQLEALEQRLPLLQDRNLLHWEICERRA
ncbi:hypothetical protein EIP91_000992 [Steccherinum ochraceum]|uniref:F-box domain-containing protein n=1 Tax=Steccherinum ochraceum TaxID=92696 RepID=A0A4R0REZ8_9APHY|nr:hypothetical protein EIP91_000992 [Steccherinum ochraceum]